MAHSVLQLSYDKTYLISVWLESLVYGFFTSMFCMSLYNNLQAKSRHIHTVHSRNMFYIGIIMWIIATVHVALNCFRLVQGYVDFVAFGSAAYMGNLALWHNISKSTLCITQEMLGDIAAIYRCYIVWQKNWKVIFIPCIIFVGSTTSGYFVCSLFPTFDPTATVFDPKLMNWITTFYVLAVAQNIGTTGLLIHRLWSADRRSSAAGRVGTGRIRPIIRILVESASLQLVVISIRLALYAADLNVQWILLEMVPPVVGITFTAISLRITARENDEYRDVVSSTGGPPSSNAPVVVNITHNVATDGSISDRGTRSVKSV